MSAGASNIFQFPTGESRIETGIKEAAADLAAAAAEATSTSGRHANSTSARQPGGNTTQAAHISDALKAAESYIRAGWRTFPGKRGNHDHRDKEPLAGWSWKKRHLTLADAPTYFDKDQHNVLVVLGSTSGNLTDLDLDWPEAVAAADLIFNGLPSFGRSGKPRSHRLAICDNVKTRKYQLPQSLANHSKVVEQPEHMMCVAEVRGGGSYTVFPGSEHATGEKVEWTTELDAGALSVPGIEPDNLLKKMGLLAFVAFCMRFFPAVGSRCDFMMAVAGALARAGYEAELIQQIIQRIGAFNNDEGDNGSWSVAADTVRGKLDKGDEVTGLPTVIKILGLGDDVLVWCREMLVTTVTPAGEPGPQAEVSFVDPYTEFVGPEFPLDILPPTLANFVNAEHRAMGADPAAIAMAALTAVAAAMHAETQVRVGDSWWEKPIVWTCLLGQPSSMKSPIIDKATKPLSRIDHGRGKVWDQQCAAWKKTPNRKEIPIPARPARCVINDATSEKVAEILSRDPSGSFIVHDELAGWLGSFERYNSGSSARALYLTAWAGGTFLKDRVGKGKTDVDAETHVDNLALCILGGIQPDLLTTKKLGDLTSDGLLQRFLPVLMKPAKLGNPEHSVEVAEAEYEKLLKSVNALPARKYHFADEAIEVRNEVLGRLHQLEQVDGLSPSLIGAIGKLKGYFARICMLLHVVQHQENAAQPEPLNGTFARATGEHLRKLFGLPHHDCLSAGISTNSAISRVTAEAAKKMMFEFLLPHMIGLYDIVVSGGQDRDRVRTIADFILASDKDRLRPSDVTAGVRSLRGEPEQKIREWVGRFCSMDWLCPEESKQGVLPKAWLVSPGLRDHFAKQRKQAQEARAEMHAILKAGGSRKRA